MTAKSIRARQVFSEWAEPTILPAEQFEVVDFNEEDLAPAGRPALQWRIDLMEKLKDMPSSKVLTYDFTQGTTDKELVRQRINTFRNYFRYKGGAVLSIKKRKDGQHNICILVRKQG